MRRIKKIHKAVFEPIADLITYRAIPTASIDHIDPFLFLNHHGPQVYPANNNGLPFGPHPHRGFETVTFILEGDIYHKDSGSNQGVILPGGVQWMTAGRGLIHSEISSDEFKKNGGKLEILQLWINLPAKFKMVEPAYKDLQKEDIPVIEQDNGEIKIQLIAGKWENTEAAYQPLADISLSVIHINAGAKLSTFVDVDRNIFFYIVRGSVIVNGAEANAFELVQFANDNSEINMSAKENSIILFGHAIPFNEKIVAQGPFVMNTEEEIYQAMDDYRAGKMGHWKE